MEAYIPKLGEMVRVELYGEIHEIRDSVDDRKLMLKVKLSEKEGDWHYYSVPTVCAEPFNPAHDSERNIA